MASKPVAKTMASSSNSWSAVRSPVGVMASMGDLRTSTSETFSRL
jgi:hypothetical protein